MTAGAAPRRARFVTALAVAGPLLLYLYWLATPINLATADLGRHLRTGERIVNGWRDGGLAVLSANVYSYTHPDFPVVNHHWGSGVLFHLAERTSGIRGVHLLFVALSLAALAVFVSSAARESGPGLAALAAVWAIPLVRERLEVRPEAWTYLLAGLFYAILSRERDGRAGRGLWALPALQAIWTNLHVYFPLGPLLVGVFLLDALRSRARRDERVARLARCLVLTMLAGLLNPAGWRGLTYPFRIFRNYGYPVLENQSIAFLERAGAAGDNVLALKLLTGALVAGFALLALLAWRRVPVVPAILAATFVPFGWLALRNLTLLGLFAIPILAALAARLREVPIPRLAARTERAILAAAGAALTLGILAVEAGPLARQRGRLGIGALPGIERAADFLEREGIRGPILNNYDIGAYLIHRLFPSERVFVDNRPEAYPATFFTDEYIPLLADPDAWRAGLERWDFDAIVFMHRDRTPWAQAFLAVRSADPRWRTVYRDAFVVVLLRRDGANAPVLRRLGARAR